jgi:GntR family transcriptional regulator
MATQPTWKRIAEDLRKRIDEGTYPPGSRLDSEKIKEEFDASQNTVSEAIKRLTTLGLVDRKPGLGTFVTLRAEPFVTVLTGDPLSGDGGDEGASYLSQVSAEHRTPSETVPEIAVQIPHEGITRRLRVPLNTQVVSRHQERSIDGVRWSLQTSFYPFDFISRGATRLLMPEDIDGGTVKYLAETIKLRQIGYRDWITARNPDANEQAFFGIAHEATVFEVFRTAFDQRKTPMRVTVTVFPADRNQFIVNVGDDLPTPQYGDDGFHQ